MEHIEGYQPYQKQYYRHLLHVMYDEKIRLGEKEITDRDLNVFFADKAMQSDVVAGWTDTAVRKLKQCLT